MRKLVPESIEETLQILKNEKLNEELNVGQWFNTVKGLIKGVFKKIGNFFVALYKNRVLPVMVPVNIGILHKSGRLPKAVQFIPNQADLDLEPSLSSLRGPEVIKERVRRGYLEDAAKNKARGKLKSLWETAVVPDTEKVLNEALVTLKYTGKDKIRNVHSDFLVKRIMLQFRNPKLIPPLIWGAPGIGKTAITSAVVTTLGPGHRVIDVQTSKMAPDDWTLPAIIATKASATDTGTKQAIDIPKNWLPVYLPAELDDEFKDLSKEEQDQENAKRNDAANWGEGGVIFLDELSRANAEVQNTCLKLVHQRIIGDRKLGSKWAIIAATNREEDDPEGGQTKIGSALANRFQHFNFIPTVDEWIAWAKGRKEGPIDERITTFIDFNRDHFYVFDNEEMVNTTPRTWEALSDMLKACDEYGDITFSRADLEDVMGGTIGSKTVEVLAAFLVLLESFRPEQIKLIFTNPDKAPKPKKKGSGFDVLQANALIGAACSQSKDMTLTAKQLENYVQYWVDLGDASLAAKALWLIVETHPYIHQETGDIKGKEKYKPAMDIFRKAFGGIKFGKREDVMGG
jgi:MoxR-like ATPase